MKKLLFALLIIAILSTIIILFLPSSATHMDDIWGDSYDVAIVLSVPLIYTEITIYSAFVYFFTNKNKRGIKTILHISIPISSMALLVALVDPFPSVSHRPANILFFCALLLSIVMQIIRICLNCTNKE